MASEAKAAPEPWEQAKEIRNKCPGASHKQARKALNRCHGDVRKAALHLKSQSEAAQTCPQKPEAKTQEDEHPLFYLQLPTFCQPVPLSDGGEYGLSFSLYAVIGAIQSKTSLDEVYHYLAFHHENNRAELESTINGEVKGYPAIFYVVEAHDIELIRRWVKYGGNINATHVASGTPLIAFAILRDHRPRLQSIEMLKVLLMLGASPLAIPAAFYSPFNRELPEFGPARSELNDIHDDNKVWCKPNLRWRLSSALGLTQRYLLNRAARLQPASGRKRALACRRNSEALLGVDLLVIGQEMAVWSLKRSLLDHLAMPSSEPLVFLFAGPSGHGKTELARKFGDLMSLEHQFVDCTMFSRENELFGPKPPYYGYQSGSPLNNFLARMSGKKSVVFMDEFEKSTKEIWNTLLIPFDQGEYVDRRTASKVDCSQTIWILATNKFDPTIHEFCVRNKRELFESTNKSRPTLLGKLVGSLRKECLSHFGAPLTGRISEIVPFLTFSLDEAAIVADKRIMELEERLARPVKMPSTKEGDNLVGNIQLDIVRDSMVCSNISENYYVPELGARSIFGGVKRAIEGKLVDQYLEAGDDFSDSQAVARFTVDVNQEDEVEVLLN